MLNTEDFILRLEKLMEFYNLSPSLFADKIAVQRSGISHLLSGRNKPSLDFILKICEEFPEVDLYWLLNGNGSLLKNDTTPTTSVTIESTPIPNATVKAENNLVKEPAAVTNKPSICKIVMFYADGSFKDFYPG